MGDKRYNIEITKFPVIYFVLCFCAALLLEKYVLSIPISITVIFIIPSTIITILVKRFIPAYTVIPLTFLLVAAFYLYSSVINKHDYSDIKISQVKNVYLQGIIHSVDIGSEGDIQLVNCSLNNYELPEDFIVLCKNINLTDNIIPGNTISLTGTIKEPNGLRNPCGFDYRGYLLGKNITAIFYQKDETTINVKKGNASFKSFIFKIRHKIYNQISDDNPELKSLITALVLGDKSSMEYGFTKRFREGGLAHLLAVSGLHVGFIFVLGSVLFGRFKFVWRNILIAILMIMFLFVSGMNPPVVRATIMAMVLILANITGRTKNIFNAISVAALIILLFNPIDLFNVSFQLSFSAVIGIVLVQKLRLIKTKNTALRWLSGYFLITIGVYIFTTPFIIYHFGVVNFSSLVNNIFGIPIISMILYSSIAGLLFIPVSNLLSGIFFGASEFYLTLFNTFLNKTLTFTSGSIIFVNQNKVAVIAVIVVFIALLLFVVVRYKSKIGRIVIGFVLTANFILLVSLINIKFIENGKLNIIYFDVGQGDATLIYTPEGKTILIDSGAIFKGYVAAEHHIIPFLERENIHKIDYAIATHSDLDHIGGFFTLAERGYIETLFKPPLAYKKAIEVKFEDFLKNKGIKIVYFSPNIVSLNFSRIYTCYLTSEDENENNRSPVILYKYGENEFLFSGDMDIITENRYCLRYGKLLTADVIKAGHHGSKSSTGDIFLDITKPKVCVISCGKNNRYGHPSDDVIKKVSDADIKIRRTDKVGAVFIKADVNDYRIVNWKNR